MNQRIKLRKSERLETTSSIGKIGHINNRFLTFISLGSREMGATEPQLLNRLPDRIIHPFQLLDHLFSRILLPFQLMDRLFNRILLPCQIDNHSNW